MKSIYGKMLLTALVSITFIALPAHALTKHVNCDEGETIGHTLETARGSGDRMDIIVSGTCNEEYINIRRDNIWFTGEDGALINGTVRVFGAKGIRFYDMTISGPGDGISVTGNGSVSAWNLVLSGNEGNGLIVRRGSVAMLSGSQIIGTCADIYDENCDDGAYVEAATLELRHTTISNSLNGIVAVAGARIILLDRRGNNSKVFNNSVVGIQVDFKSLVDLRGTTHLHDNRHHAIYALLGSGVKISSPGVNVNGNIGCQDWISFLSNPGGGHFDSTWCVMH